MKPLPRIADVPAGSGRYSGVPAGRTARARILPLDARSVWFAATVGAAIVILAGVPLAAALNIWIDEAFTLHTTGAGAAYALQQSIAFEAQPPLYFVLEALWRSLDEGSIAFARLPSIVFAAAAVAVIVGATYRLAPQIPPLTIAFLTALNPLIIWAAVEMRVYALVVLVSAVLTWTFFEGFVVPNPSRRAQILYVVFAIAGLYVQYYVGFLLVAHACALLVLRRAMLPPFIVAGLIVATAFAPFAPIAVMHVEGSGDFSSRATFAKAIHEIANAVFVFVLPHDVDWSGAPKLLGFAVAALLVIGLFVFGRPAKPTEPFRAVALQWLISIAVFTLLFTISGVPLNPLRHLTVLAPPSLLVAYVFTASLTRGRAVAGAIALVAFAAFTITTLWTQYRPPLAKRGEWQRVAAFLSADDAATPVAVFPAELAMPLSRYFPAPTVPVPGPMPFTMQYLRAETLTDESEVARVLDPVGARSDRLWMITTGYCKSPQAANDSYNCRYLESYLNRRYRPVKTIEFRGALMRLYVRYPNVSLEVPVRRNAN